MENKVDLKILIEDGILFLYVENTDVDLALVKKIVETRLEYSKGKSYPMFSYLNNTRFSTKEAREYLITKGSEGLSAVAFMATNVVARVIINSFLVVYRPKMPTKIFTDKEKAIEWLKQFVD